MRAGNCPLEDDMHQLIDKIIDCDGVIISSPVYMSNVTGTLKIFIDRLCHWYHRPQLVGLPEMSVVTTAGGSLNYVQKYIEKVAMTIGLHPTDRISKTIRELEEGVTLKDIDSFIWHLYNKRDEYKPSLKQIINYNVQKVLAMNVLEEDRKYWEQRGWDQAPFYYDCHISFWKKAIGLFFYKLLFNAINSSK